MNWLLEAGGTPAVPVKRRASLANPFHHMWKGLHAA
jgi:hypothetical protein